MHGFRKGAWIVIATMSASCGARTGLETNTSESSTRQREETDAYLPSDLLDVGEADSIPQDLLDGGEGDRPPSDARTEDVLRPRLPSLDASPTEGGCDPHVARFLVVDDVSVLYEFEPAPFSLRRVAAIPCLEGNLNSPYTIAIDGNGVVYILLLDWNIYRLDPVTASCVKTAFVAGQQGLPGNVSFDFDRAAGPSERLYLLGGDKLAVANTRNFVVSVIGQVPSLGTAELRTTASGRMFAFSTDPLGSVISEIDPSSATLIAQDILVGVQLGTAWSFAEWGGNFYLFNSENVSSSTVRRYSLALRAFETLGDVPIRITGAATYRCSGL